MDINKSVLDSGLRVITARLPYLRTVNIAVAVGGGTRYGAKEHAGISHLLEHLIFMNQKNQDAIAAIEGLGGEFDILTFEEDFLFGCRIPSRHLARGMRLFFGILSQPSFSEESFEREKRVILEEDRAIIGNPTEYLMPFFAEKFWEGHPLEAVSPMVSLAALPGINLSTLEQFYRQLFVSGNMVITAVGNVNHREFVKEMEALSTDIPVGEPVSFPKEQVRSGTRVEGMPFASEQLYLTFGCETVSLFHPDRYILDLIASFLGMGMSSQLFIKVRYETGLVYEIEAFHAVFLDTGYFVIRAICAPENAEKVLDLSLLELQALREGKVEGEKLAAAKERLAGFLEAQLEDAMSLAMGFARQELFKGKVVTPGQVADKIRGISLQNVVRVSNEVLDPDKFLLVVLGPLRQAQGKLD